MLQDRYATRTLDIEKAQTYIKTFKGVLVVL
jgi:hypothetical protein